MKNKYHILVILFLNINLFFGQTCDINNAIGGNIKTHPNSQMGIFGNLNNDGSFFVNLYDEKIIIYNLPMLNKLILR